MALSKEVSEVIRIFSGQKSSVPFGSLQSSDAVRLLNFVTRKGSLRKIWGGTVYAQPVFASGSGGILWVDRYNNRWIIEQGSVVAIETAESSAVFTEFVDSFTTQASKPGGTLINLRIASTRWRDFIFMLNGKQNKFFNSSLSATLLKTIGVIPPGNGYATGTTGTVGTAADSGGGSGPDAGLRSYLVTWYDSDTGTESLPNGAQVDEDGLWSGSASFSTPSHVGTNSINIDISALLAAGYDARVTGWFLYRAQVSDGVFKRVFDTALSTGTSTYVDSVADSGLGTILNTINSSPPDGTHYLTLAGGNLQGANCIGPRFLKYWRNQLWMFGASYPGNDDGFLPVKSILYASDVDNSDYWLYSYDIDRSNEEEDSGLAEHERSLIVLKTKSIHFVDGTSPDNYVIRKLDAQRGCIAPGSIQETPKGIICLSSDGFILIDALGPAKLITDVIFDEIEAINRDHLDKICSSYDLTEGKYECHLPTGANTDNSKVFIYDVNQGSWQFRNRALGQSVKYGLDSSNSPVSLLGDQLNSRVYSITDTEEPTFNGQTILASFASKHFDFGEPEKRKRLDRIIVKAKAITDFRITVDIVMDFGERTISYDALVSESEFSVWASSSTDPDGMVWDRDNWAGGFIDRKFEIKASGIARNFQIIIRESENTAARAGFQIEEIVLKGNLLGR